ncbi:hypothetical protein N1851_012516 [Merluccius polli]|uniref:Uncharacterized protein n=1 Tax=Merluccius polli TaxID=89951 RepID=A0AA47MX35_MERPO|nr:hypothetical protein N1851_012516 [Merluccius polli]
MISRIASGKIIKNYKLQKTIQTSLGCSRNSFGKRNQISCHMHFSVACVLSGLSTHPYLTEKPVSVRSFIHSNFLGQLTWISSQTQYAVTLQAKNACMECAKCRSNKLNRDYDAEAPVRFVQWTTELGEIRKNNKESEKESQPVRMTVKKEMVSSLGDMTDMFQNQLRVFTRHQFNIKPQYIHYPPSNTAYGNPSCGWSGQTFVLHGHLSIKREKSACYMDTPVPCARSCEYPPSISNFGSFGTQYCQKGNFYMLSTELFKKGFKKGTWSFFEASHGKGAPDGVGGVFTKNSRQIGKDIPNARQLYDCLNAQTSIQLFYIDKEAVDKAVQKMPKRLPVVPLTMRLHQMNTLTPGKVIVGGRGASAARGSCGEGSGEPRQVRVIGTPGFHWANHSLPL